MPQCKGDCKSILMMFYCLSPTLVDPHCVALPIGAWKTLVQSDCPSTVSIVVGKRNSEYLSHLLKAQCH